MKIKYLNDDKRDFFLEEEGRLTFYADISSEGVLGHERYGLSLHCYENRKRVFSVSQKS